MERWRHLVRRPCVWHWVDAASGGIHPYAPLVSASFLPQGVTYWGCVSWWQTLRAAVMRSARRRLGD